MEPQKALDRARPPRISQKVGVKFVQGSIFYVGRTSRSNLTAPASSQPRADEPCEVEAYELEAWDDTSARDVEGRYVGPPQGIQASLL